MKNISLILNIVLLLAVAYLYVDKFSSNEPSATEATINGEEDAGDSKIVFINIDTLQSKSKSYQATKKDLEDSFAKTRATLISKEKAFQNDVADYQKKASTGSLTPNQAKQIEERLAGKQQEIMQLQETASAELEQKTNDFDAKFTGDIKKYSDSLRVANGYDFVLLYGGVISPMLSANNSYDITNTVVELLNKDQ